MCIRFRRNVRNIARLTFTAVRKIAILKMVSLHVTRLKTDFLLTYLTECDVMTKIHSPAGLSFFFPSENRRPAKRKSVLVSPVIQKFKCACSAIQRG